jgi:serine protease Do
MVQHVFLSALWLVMMVWASASAQAAVTGLPDFTELVEKYSPAVVKIQTEYSGKNNTAQRDEDDPQDPDQDIPEIFRHFFGDDPRLYPQPMPHGRQNNMPPRRAMGSGFVIAADGYILTNSHVVDDADKITVDLNDGDEYPATLVGKDARSDLALIKINAKNLPVLAFSKTSPKVGEWVLAIGSPFGLDYSASAGIVSAIGRSLPSENGSNYVPFIQTDVAINPGNSGGPLFNLNGEVVGINSQIFTRSGGYMGLSFAIPADLAISVVAQLKDKGFVSRGWLGVSIQDVDRDLASSFGLDKPRGALVAQLVPNSPSQGLLENGDIILSINGTEIRKSGDLPHLVGATPAGTTVALKVLHDRKEKVVNVKLGELPDDTMQKTVGKNMHAPHKDSILGLAVVTADAHVRKELNIPGGVVVHDVAPDSPADATGLMPGDVITQLGLVAINNEEDFRKQAAALPKGSPQAIRFFRRGEPVFRTILVP